MNSAPAPGQSPSPSTVAVFVDPGGPPLTALLASLLLEANGSPIVHGVDGNEVLAGAHYVVFRIADFKAGGWDLTLTGASALPAATDIELHASVHRPGQANVEAITIVCESIQRVGLAGPEGLGGCGGSAAGSGASLLPEVGDQVLVGFLPGDPTGAPDRPVITGRVYNAADGSTHELEFLANEGAEEFTGQGSGFLSAPFRATSHGSPAGIPDDPPPPRQVGSYNLRVEAGAPPGPSLAGLGPNLDVDVEAVSILRRSFHVLEAGGGTPDRDGDSLPDRYEDRYECLDGGAGDALADGDGDTLTNAAELAAGTHPCTADTDEGGEQDGSEVRGGRNPLDPGDDALPRVPGAYVLQQGFEHEDIDLWEPGTLPIMYDGHARFSDIVLKRGTIGRATPAWDTVVFNPKLHPGVYLDRGLTPGEEYCYQLYGVDSAGNEGAPTPVFCAAAKNDPQPPLGDLRLEDAAPSSDAAMLTATLDLYNKEPSTTEMSIGIDTHPDSAWVPYLNEFPVDPGPYAGPWPRTVQVYAALRDAEGGVSEIYTDTILLWPPGSLGGIVGLVQAAPGGTPLGGAYVEVLAPAGASPDTADAGGGFGLDELEPGSYTLKFSYPGFLPLTVAGVQVLAGETTDLGVVLLGPGIFADGFE
jgi:hypothetical protein